MPPRHVDPSVRRSAPARGLAAFSATRAGRAFSEAVVWRVDPWLHRVTRGRAGLAWPLPTAVLQTRGARSGQPRENALLYFHDGDRVVVIASKAGAASHPSWLHNLRAHPDDVRFGGVPVRPVEVTDPAERARLWALADRLFAPFAQYRRDAARAGREIPIVLLVSR